MEKKKVERMRHITNSTYEMTVKRQSLQTSRILYTFISIDIICHIY